MTRILLVGQDPKTVDFSDPALPPGLDAAKIQAGIDATLADMRARGWTVDACSVPPGEAAADQLRDQLARATYDCVVIGGGVRVPPKNLRVFEKLLNIVHRHAPTAAIAFNTVPGDSADAAARWVDG